MLYLPIKIDYNKLYTHRQRNNSAYLDKFMSFVHKDSYPVKLDKSCSLTSAGGYLIEEFLLDIKFNKVEIRLSDASYLFLLFLMVGRNKSQSFSSSKLVLKSLEGKSVHDLITNGLNGIKSGLNEAFDMVTEALFVKSLYYNNSFLNVKSRLYNDVSRIQYSAQNELRFNVSVIYLRLMKSIQFLARTVLCQGDRIVLDITDNNLNTLKKVLKFSNMYLEFDIYVYRDFKPEG